MNRISERIARLEAAAPAQPQRVVRRHILDCPPEEKAERLAAIQGAEPAAFHIVRVVVTPNSSGLVDHHFSGCEHSADSEHHEAVRGPRASPRGESEGRVSYWLPPKAYDAPEFVDAWDRIGFGATDGPIVEIPQPV